MQIKSKYKIARRLGANIFDKTQTQKYALRNQDKKMARPRPKSDFGMQLLEKQRARYFYGINERQFKKYVREVIEKGAMNPDEMLYERLERRLDNVVYRLKLAPTRQAARQMVSHGHIVVNGVRVDVPSFGVKQGDKISIRPGSLKKPLFAKLDETIKDHLPPSWLAYDHAKKEAIVQGAPKLVKTELPFDFSPILEYYKR